MHDGATIDADLVVIAEGLRSRARGFVTAADVNDLGMYFAYLTIPRRDTDDQWWNWQHAPGSRAVHLRPDNLGTTRAILTFISDVRGLEDLSRIDQIAILRKSFADVGGPAQRILAELDSAPLYFDALGQVRTPRWSKGRIALLGDAAFCNATFGGGGTSLALIGAYVLAGELARTDDESLALTRYEQFLRPRAESKDVSTRVLRTGQPSHPERHSGTARGSRLLAGPVGRTATKLLGQRGPGVAADGLQLPDYPPVEVVRQCEPYGASGARDVRSAVKPRFKR